MAKKKRKNLKYSKIVFISIATLSVLLVSGSVISESIRTVEKSGGFFAFLGMNEEVGKIGEIAEEVNLGEIKEEFKNEIVAEQVDFAPSEVTTETTTVSVPETTIIVPEKHNNAGTVKRIKDGDTYVVTVNGEDITFRLIGVDTPESVAPESYRTGNTEEGKEISDIVKDKLTVGTTVYIEYDVSQTDKYGRHLAYLYFEDGTMVQEWLLRNGYANIATYPPNVKYTERFTEIAHNACEEKVGLWNGFFEHNKNECVECIRNEG